MKKIVLIFMLLVMKSFAFQEFGYAHLHYGESKKQKMHLLFIHGGFESSDFKNGFNLAVSLPEKSDKSYVLMGVYHKRFLTKMSYEALDFKILPFLNVGMGMSIFDEFVENSFKKRRGFIISGGVGSEFRHESLLFFLSYEKFSRFPLKNSADMYSIGVGINF